MLDDISGSVRLYFRMRHSVFQALVLIHWKNSLVGRERITVCERERERMRGGDREGGEGIRNKGREGRQRGKKKDRQINRQRQRYAET